MNLWRLNNHLHDSLRVDGDICLINLSHAAAHSNMEKIGAASQRTVYTTLEEGEEYCFIFIDSAKVTLDLLEKAWDKVSYGGTMFFSSYTESVNVSDRVIKTFLKSKTEESTMARQMLLNGKREQTLIVKCFQTDKKELHPMDNTKVTVATVLKSGGEYTVDYVNHIASSIKGTLSVPYNFVCLTDLTDGFNKDVHQIIPFENDFPKWWGKIELFKPNKFDTEKIFYLDLDTIIVDNIDDIVQYGGEFFGLRDFYHQYGLGSGLMCWKNNNPRIHQIYEKFMESPTANMNNNRYGDQEFINGVLGKNMDYVQDLYPKNVVSYKKDCATRTGEVSIPDKAKIICFHGPPRPHQIRNPLIQKYWRG